MEQRNSRRGDKSETAVAFGLSHSERPTTCARLITVILLDLTRLQVAASPNVSMSVM